MHLRSIVETRVGGAVIDVSLAVTPREARQTLTGVSIDVVIAGGVVSTWA